jgi:hypothetical protein
LGGGRGMGIIVVFVFLSFSWLNQTVTISEVLGDKKRCGIGMTSSIMANAKRLSQ